MAQDVVGGGAVEIEIRQHVIEQQPLPAELAFVAAELENELLVLGAVDLGGLEAFDVFDGVGEPALELREARLGIRQVDRLAAGERAAGPNRVGSRCCGACWRFRSRCMTIVQAWC